MKRYDVWIYPVAKIKVPNVEADSQIEAIKKAEKTVKFYDLFRRCGEDVEFAEDIAYYLVDEVGDEEYENSQWYDIVDGKIVLGKEHKECIGSGDSPTDSSSCSSSSASSPSSEEPSGSESAQQ